MVRGYADTGRADVAGFIRRMGTFLLASTKVVPDAEYDSNGMIRPVDYATNADGPTYAPDGPQAQQGPAGSGARAWAYYFSLLTHQPNPAFRSAAQQLYDTFDLSVNFWTRPAAPASMAAAYRISPWRKYAWQFRTSGSLSWCMGQ